VCHNRALSISGEGGVKHNYAVLGAGRQGTAAAYDLAKNGQAAQVRLGDANLEQARSAAARVNKLLGREAAIAAQVDARDVQAVQQFLTGSIATVSAVPYYLNLGIARAAIAARTSICDLGGNTEIVFQELALDAEARRAGISIVPDCGMVPGLGTSVCAAAMEMVEQPRDVYLWDGGLPQQPQPPWNYILTFHFEGLINEYFGTTEFLREGRITEVPCFEEYELVDFPAPIGQLEAFTTAGGTSSAPRTFLGKLRTYQNKTLRYQGHYQQWKTLRDAGLFDLEPAEVKGARVRPRDLLAAVLDPKIRAKPGEKDVCIIRARAEGESAGKPAAAVVDLFDYYDEATGFTAMERTTGWHAAIMAILMARGGVAKGAVPVERAVTGTRMLEECRARGMRISTHTE
jgi:lysine 6-dehydrogenase